MLAAATSAGRLAVNVESTRAGVGRSRQEASPELACFSSGPKIAIPVHSLPGAGDGGAGDVGLERARQRPVLANWGENVSEKVRRMSGVKVGGLAAIDEQSAPRCKAR